MTRLRIGFDVAVVAVCAIAVYQSLGFTELARTFPLAISVTCVCLGLLTLVGDLLRWRRTGTSEAGDTAETAVIQDIPGGAVQALKDVLPYLLWFLGCVALIFLFGLLVGCTVFVAAFLFFEAHARRGLLVIGTAATFVGLTVLTAAMNLELPEHFIYFW